MKNNNFLIALALCIGLSSINFCVETKPEDASPDTSWSGMPGRWFQSAKSAITSGAATIRSNLPGSMSEYSYTQLMQGLIGLIVLAKAWGLSKDYIIGIVNAA